MQCGVWMGLEHTRLWGRVGRSPHAGVRRQAEYHGEADTARDAHPDELPPGNGGAGGCCGVACCSGWDGGWDWDWDCCCDCNCCCCCCWLWSTPMRRYPACTRKSHTRLVLFTSIFTRSRASRRRNLPPRRAYSRTSVSLITK
jgi:hypothetical protein